MRKAQRACIEPGCPNYTFASRCPEHAVLFELLRTANGATGHRRDTPEWRRARRAARRRDHDRCRQCGSSRQLHVHHVNGDAHDNRLANLKTLCKACHEQTHQSLLPEAVPLTDF